MNMDSTMYADTINRRYPIQNKKAALESYQTAVRDGALNLPEVKANFDKAASFYHIQWPTMEKQAAMPESITYDIGDETLTLSKIATCDDLQKAAAAVVSLRDRHTRKELKKAASAVLDVASWLDADMDTPELRKVAQIAGIGVGEREEIERELMKRATLNDLAGSHAAFWDAVRNVQALPDEDFFKCANLENICGTIEDIDQHFGNTHRYGKDLKAPEAVVFGSNVNDMLKEASDLLSIPSIDTVLSKKAVLERKDAINSFFDAHFVKKAQKEAENDENLFEKLASMDELTARAFLDAFKD